MPRSNILNFLSNFNKNNGLDTNIWGNNAKKAVAEALNKMGLDHDNGDPNELVLVNEFSSAKFQSKSIFDGDSNELINKSIACDYFVDSKQAHNFLLLKNISVMNWHGYWLLHEAGKVFYDLSSVYAPLSKVNELRIDLNDSLIFKKALLVSHDSDPTNYCHFVVDWFVQCLVLFKNADINTVIFPSFIKSQFHDYFLNKLKDSGKEVFFLNEMTSVKVEELFFINSGGGKNTHPAMNLCSDAINFLGSLEDKYKKNYSDSKDILWISRDKTRILLDEELIIQQLKSKFNIVKANFDGMDVKDQIELIKKSKVLIGVHGAGFVNLCFTDHKIKIVEIFAEKNGTPAFKFIANVKDCEHFSYFGNLIDTGISNYPNIKVDIDKFVNFIIDKVMR